MKASVIHKKEKTSSNSSKSNVFSKSNEKNEECSVFSWLKAKKFVSQNVVTQLFHREINLYPKQFLYSTRKFYQNITPNFTVTSVQKPPCVLRKFTPDGK